MKMMLVGRLFQKLCFSRAHPASSAFSFSQRWSILYRCSLCPCLMQNFDSRCFSSRPPAKLNLLSDVEDYVAKDFTLSDLQKQLDEENLPAPVTTASLLQECQTLEDVMKELGTVFLTGKLWKDELVLYYRALLEVRSEILGGKCGHNLLEDVNDREMTTSSLQKLHDNPSFQFLLKETLVHSPWVTTKDLSFIFYAFTALKIPPTSNPMVLLIATLQNRINGLFPSDVLRCLFTIRLLKPRTTYITSLRKGLVLHLENQTVDAPMFRHVLKSTSLTHRLQLLTNIHPQGSSTLKSDIYYSIIETIKSRKPVGLQSAWEAENVLKTQLRTRVSNSFLLRAAGRYFHDNQQNLLPRHRFLMRNVEKYTNINGLKIIHHLQSEIQHSEKIDDRDPLIWNEEQ